MKKVIKEIDMANKGIEYVRCFFCEKGIAKFVNGKGNVVLGDNEEKTAFGIHAHCGCLNKRLKKETNNGKR